MLVDNPILKKKIKRPVDQTSFSPVRSKIDFSYTITTLRNAASNCHAPVLTMNNTDVKGVHSLNAMNNMATMVDSFKQTRIGYIPLFLGSIPVRSTGSC